MDRLRRDSYTGANWRRSYAIRDCDARDTARSTAPLTMAANAALLDTIALTIEESVTKAIALVEARRAARRDVPPTEHFSERLRAVKRLPTHA